MFDEDQAQKVTNFFDSFLSKAPSLCSSPFVCVSVCVCVCVCVFSSSIQIVAFKKISLWKEIASCAKLGHAAMRHFLTLWLQLSLEWTNPVQSTLYVKVLLIKYLLGTC